MVTAPNLPPVIASRYVPVRLIAKGGMGAVYEVEHARTGEHLALKLLLSSVGSSPEELERFKREARASARIKSEHVVRVTDADVAPELGGAPFLVMELLEGADLEREATATPPSPATVIGWLSQVARALDKAHQLGIIHRDLKPENLFLARAEDRAPIVKILDFGIVKMAQEGGGSGVTGSGQILGTPRYMAPEQAGTQMQVTSAADRYALGMVAYRFLAGESYYKGDVLNVLAQLLHAPLQPPSQRHLGFGSAFDAWFLRACHRDPAERFPSAVVQIEALSSAFASPAITIKAEREPLADGGIAPSFRRVRSAVWIALGVAGLSIGGMLLKTLLHPSRPATPPAAALLSRAPAPRSPEPSPSRPRTLPHQQPTVTEAPVAATDSPPPRPPQKTAKPHAPRRPDPDPRSTAAAAVPAPLPLAAPDPYADQK